MRIFFPLLVTVFLCPLHAQQRTFFYAKGGHSYGMDNPTSEVDWMDACLIWLCESGFFRKK